MWYTISRRKGDVLFVKMSSFSAFKLKIRGKKMKLIQDFITKTDKLKEIINATSEGNVLVSGVTPSLIEHLIQTINLVQDRPTLVVVRNEHEGRRIHDNLVELGVTNVLPFLLEEFMTTNAISASSELRFERMATLKTLAVNSQQIVIANLSAIRRFLTPQSELLNAEVELKIGSIYEPTDLTQKAVQLGYQRVSTVMAVGEFAARGGIFDIFPKEAEHPIRIEFFDDEVETIRTFDEQTQRSISQIDQADITLLYELYYSRGKAERFASTIEPLVAKQSSGLSAENKDVFKNIINNDTDRVESFSDLDLIHKYITVLHDSPATILDYLPNPQLIWVGADKIALHAEATDEEVRLWNNTQTAAGELLAGIQLQNPFDLNISSSQIFFSEHTKRIEAVKLSKIVNFTSKGIEEYHGNLDLFIDECQSLIKRSKTVVIISNSADLRVGVMNRLTKAGVSVNSVNVSCEAIEDSLGCEAKTDFLQVQSVNVIAGQIPSGFELIDDDFVVFTDYEIRAGGKRRQSKYKGKVRDGVRIKDVNALELGDFVVHLQHGIGRYIGVETIDMLGLKRDVITLEYKRGDRVYVPIDKIDMVQKYVGSEGVVPKLSRLGGKDWEETKKAASKLVKDIARELVAVYAKRKYLPGFSFSKDTAMQREFEDACTFVETPDQLKTTAEIKDDMERPHPMDRLLVGDVGYGKTEVAMRAAMKAVVDHKQVVYVAPTTILVRQQYENFKKRFANHAVEIRVLNRHLSQREIDKTLAEVALGKIDILIGTHRVLSKDVKFKDLGLLIVDEEQRFGVEHKEAIKKLKTDVDVLTLTATPIPRTMQMSMVGIRGMSMIETPPANRYPVQTYVLEAHDSVIRDAIERELARGGQVFYLHNRVTSLPAHVKKIQKLVPDARIGYAHGKMPKEVIEDTMQDFEDRKFDVLVCTTIIETGIDIPNANTLIVGDAYRLGLSQMYQLRGRVGRSDRIAYAYFLYPQNYVLTENSEKRLQTIREFTALGSGFKIAMRDLAIRGAGDMLGTRQNGFLDTVGLDLYTKMLAEAIKVADGGNGMDQLENMEDLTTEMLSESARDLDIGVGIDRYIPDDYIGDASLKIEMYKKMKALKSNNEYEELKLEFVDRFGEMPEGVESLVDLMYLKNLINPIVESSKVTKTTLEFTIKGEVSAKIDVKVLYGAANEIGKIVKVLFKDAKFVVVFDMKMAGGEAVPSAIELFEDLRKD